MFEVRVNPLSGRSVLFADGRAGRPNDFGAAVVNQLADAGAANCPFCPGNEAQTPPPLLTINSSAAQSNAAPWSLRVVPNKFPALDTGAGVGAAHEVIIESPRHLRSLGELSIAELAEVLWVFRQRLEFHKRRGVAYVQIFKNVGQAAGATLVHTHSQLLAMPFVPVEVTRELSATAEFFAREKTCLLCDMIRRVRSEPAGHQRLVLDRAEAIAFCPSAARFAWETWLLPARHESAFEALGENHVNLIAAALGELIGRIERAAGQPAYNLILRTMPFDSGATGHYHWRIEVIPRTTNVAGFELGSGCFINSLWPESAAQRLRQVRLELTG